MAKSQQKMQARVLRRDGRSIKEIAKIVSVSPSTVSLWCRDIALTQSQILALEVRNKDPFYGKRLANVRKQQVKRIEKSRLLYDEGRQAVGVLNKRELFLAGVALYWAAGFKKDSQVGFANIDPDMVKLFIVWTRSFLNKDLGDLSLRVSVNVAHEYRLAEIHEYWSSVTGVPVSQFQKPYLQKVVWKKQYENPLDYYGILRIKVRRSKDLLRKIEGMIAGLKGVN